MHVNYLRNSILPSLLYEIRDECYVKTYYTQARISKMSNNVNIISLQDNNIFLLFFFPLNYENRLHGIVKIIVIV